ncbi:MAG: response regulator, partial [Candidatus Zapsychrus exili]|nr:response regulator [Candidatus Zapsychrus exili]
MKNILLVDDEANDRMLRSGPIENIYGSGSVSEATSGQEALDYIVQQTPDLVLMDIEMPGFSGIETAKRMRAAGYTNPIVLWTARASLVDRLNPSELGVDDIVDK